PHLQHITFHSHPPPLIHTYTLPLHDALPIFLGWLVSSKAKATRPYTSRITCAWSTHAWRTASASATTAEPLSDHGSPRVRRPRRSEEHTSELQSRSDLVCRLMLGTKNRRARL